MNTTMPLVAGLSYDGRPEFAAHPTFDATGVTVWFAEPVIPAGLQHVYRWATATEVTSPHVVLDIATVAELLYGSRLATGDDPGDDQLRATVTAELDRWHCNLKGLLSLIAWGAWDCGQVCAVRMSWCRELALRLIGTDA